MKKLISVALVLVMLFTLTVVSASALISPSGKKYYAISTSAVGDGIAESDKNKVDQEPEVQEDGYATLTATEKGGYFILWDIEGDFNPVEGDANSPRFVIEPKSDVHATAYFVKEEGYFTITTAVEGDGTAAADPVKVAIGSDGTVTLTATDGKDTFVNWTLTGVYEIISGDATSRVMVIKPKTDIHAVAKFASESAPTEPSTPVPTETPGTPGTSPKTGDPTMMIIVLALAAMGLGLFAVKKIKE